MRFYISELLNEHALARAEEIDAKSLTSAMKVATKKQLFYGTVIKIGNDVDKNMLISNVLAIKKSNNKWYKYQWFDDDKGVK